MPMLGGILLPILGVCKNWSPSPGSLSYIALQGQQKRADLASPFHPLGFSGGLASHTQPSWGLVAAPIPVCPLLAK